MPIFDFMCVDCGKMSEILVSSSDQDLACTFCGSANIEKRMSAPSSYSGSKSFPGSGDTACCGSSPGQAQGCAGPGSCCGKTQGW
ncbi:MAG: zinc ribbon domain-containing protein [Proteobacteria bacterium]|nr:zinc ribbon domain-containing protein [Pseudomonadota bacterium]